MYVCICNALRDKELKSAARETTCVNEVFRRCGARPQCGKCLPDVAEIISESRSEDTATIAVAAE